MIDKTLDNIVNLGQTVHNETNIFAGLTTITISACRSRGKDIKLNNILGRQMED